MSEEIDEKEYCERYIKKFITDFNSGKIKNHFKKKITDITNIKDFFFGNLYLNKTYGYGYNTDSDSSELAKVIQYLYFDSILNGNKELSEKIKLELKIEQWKLKNGEGDGYYHTILFNNKPLDSGDTLNTFATLFSRACEASLDGQIFEKTQGICRKDIYDKLSNKKLKDFHENFNKIGNFMLLPYSRYYSINKFRAGWKQNGVGWYDYFDLFLKAIKIWYDNKEKQEHEIKKKLEENFENIKHSDFAFDNFISILNADENKNYFEALGSFENFIKFNCLEPFFERIEKIDDFKKFPINSEFELKKLRVIDRDKDIVCYHWMNEDGNNISTDDYSDFAENYITKATEIINLRSEKLLKL